MIHHIKQNKQTGAFTLIELLVVIAIIGILASMLLPTLAKAKKKGNRLKCANNIGQTTKGLTAAAQEHEDKFPWMMTAEQGNFAYRDYASKSKGNTRDSGWWWAKDIRHMWMLPSVRQDVGSCKSLLSPSDPVMARENQKQYVEVGASGANGWGIRNNNGKDDSHLSRRAQSYGVCLGGDTMLSESIVLTTRNVAGDGWDKNKKRAFNRGDRKVYLASNQNLHRIGWDGRLGLELNHASSGKWADPDVERQSNNGKHYVMNGLDANQGSFSLSDGSVTQGTDSELESAVVKHMESQGGNLTEQTSALMRPTYH